MGEAALRALPGLGQSPPIQDPDFESLVFDELRLTVRLMRVVRVVANLALVVLAFLLLIVEDDLVGFGIVLLAAVGLLLLNVLDRTGLDDDAPITRRRLLNALGAGFTFQTVFIVFTGGIESPFLVLYVPLMMIAAVALGQRRSFWLAFLLPAAMVTFLGVGYWTGPLDGLLPSFLSAPIAYTALFGGVVLTAVLVGGNVGLSARGALERSIRATEQARAGALTMLLERNRELNELSGALAHELKNPLTAIHGLSAVLARKLPADSREAEQMDVLVREAKRMGAILEEFLNFSRPTRELSLEDVTPAALIDDVVTLHESYASRRRIGFHVTIDAHLPLRCDARKIKQVLVNLVQNALDATPDGGQISLGVRARGDTELVIVVDDTGPGLSSAIQGRLFTPGTTTKAAGSGLGLTIAQAIVHQHGGSIELSDRPEGGCRATVCLPLVPVERPADQAGEAGSLDAADSSDKASE